jgi:ribonuclease BN (tRNA processing enzyme)
MRAGGAVLAYTGDSGPSPDLSALARDADVLLAEASLPERVPPGAERHLSSARQAGEVAARASVRHLVLTHLFPGTDPDGSEAAARRSYGGALSVARAGLVVEASASPPGEPEGRVGPGAR